MNRRPPAAPPDGLTRARRGAPETGTRNPAAKEHWVYILRCADGSLYTGFTVDVGRRLALHRSGRGAKYTRSRLPVALVYAERAPSLGRALRRENEIKRMSRKEKVALLSKPGPKIDSIR